MYINKGSVALWTLIFIIVIFLLIGGMVALIKEKKGGGGGEIALTRTLERGNVDSPVTFGEYADFQCPACKSALPLIETLFDEYGDRVRFVFRHFPLRSIHPNAQASSEAAEAAHMQGKFFEMHNMLYENQEAWSRERNPRDTFEKYAEEIGLDIEQFRTDVKSKQVRDNIQAEVAMGFRVGIGGTPTFYLGDKVLKAGTLLEFRAAIDTALVEAGLASSTVPFVPSVEFELDVTN